MIASTITAVLVVTKMDFVTAAIQARPPKPMRSTMTYDPHHKKKFDVASPNKLFTTLLSRSNAGLSKQADPTGGAA